MSVCMSTLVGLNNINATCYLHSENAHNRCKDSNIIMAYRCSEYILERKILIELCNSALASVFYVLN